MKSLIKMAQLADRFESKLKRIAQEKPVISQQGTTELFFGDEGKQNAFNNAIQDPNGAPYKVLLNAYNKSGGAQAASFNLKTSADPGKGASWVLDVQPPALKGAVSSALDGIFQKMMGTSMGAKVKAADAAAKGGSGSGVLDVGSLELAP